MDIRFLAISLILVAGSAKALDADRLMTELAWEKRVLLVFSPTSRHADYRRQLALLAEVDAGLRERDMTLIEAFADDRVRIDGKEREPAASGFYQRLSVSTGDFRVILVGKDGMVKLERTTPVTSRDLFALIDAMPMRRMEIRQDD